MKLLTKSIFLACACFCQTILAADLVEVFQQAAISDPSFKQSGNQRLSNHQSVPIARAGLLPTLGLSADSTRNHLTNKSASLIPQFANVNQGDFTYFSTSYTLSLSQPLFNFEAWALLQEAKATVKAADATYAAQVQSLIATVSNAYFDVLLAEDNLVYIQAEKRAVYRQLDQVRQQYKVGLIAITGVYQAQASYDLIVSEEIAAKNNIQNAKEDLRAITGVYYKNLAKLKSGVPLLKPDPVDVNKWVCTAETQNWNIQAARFNAEAAKDNINVQQSGHFPIVNAVGSFNRTETGTQPGGRTNTRLGTYGVELSLPIFEGFSVTSSSVQAKYDYQGTLDALEETRRSVVNNTRQNYNNVLAGISKIKADRQAIVSNQSSLKSTEEAYRVGTQTVLDVLQAQQDLFDAQRIYSRDQYALINATIALKEAAGTLSIVDLQQINTWLTHSKKSYHEKRIEQLEQESRDALNPDTSWYLKKLNQQSSQKASSQTAHKAKDPKTQKGIGQAKTSHSKKKDSTQ